MLLQSILLAIPMSLMMRVLLTIIALLLVAARTFTNPETFLETVSKFSAGFLFVVLAFIAIFAYTGLLPALFPLVLAMLGAILLKLGPWLIRETY